MQAPSLSKDEERRLIALRNLGLLDTAFEERFDRLTRVTARLFDVPIAYISLIDEKRQWLKSCYGTDIRETERDISFCGHAILSDEPFVINDSLSDERFKDNPLVVGPPHVRFYAGMPLATEDHMLVGTLCIVDRQPRVFSEEDIKLLRDMAQLVRDEMSVLGSKELTDRLRKSEARFLSAFESASIGMGMVSPEGRWMNVNPALCELFGYASAELQQKTFQDLTHAEDLAKDLENQRRMLAGELNVLHRDKRYVRKDGQVIWARVSVSLVRDPSGRPLHFITQVQDITEQRKAMESLRLFRALVDHSSDGIEVLEPETGRFLDVNERSCQRLGYNRQEMLSMCLPDVEDSKGSHFFSMELLHEIRSEKAKVVELSQRRKDGTVLPVEIDARLIHLGGDYIVALVRDIAERKQSEKMLLRLALIINSSDDAIIGKTLDGIITSWNPGAEKVFGYNAEEAIGQSMLMLFPPDRRGEEAEILSRLSRGESVKHFETRRVRKDGRQIDVSVTLSPIIDSHGKIIGASKIARDITGRKKTERVIAEQAAFLDKARDAILVRDLEGRVLFWNKGAERVYGWSREEVLGKKTSELIYADPKKFDEPNRIAIEKSEWSGELRHLTKNKQDIIIEARWTLIRDDFGNPKSILAINSDITEKKRIESQFLRAQRMESIGTLAGGIAHDLNNVLAPIIMSIALLKSMTKDEDILEILETINLSARRGADIVRQVLSFARGLEGRRQEIQPKHLIKDIASIIKEAFPKDIRLDFSVPTDTWTILGDPTQVHQVLLNLSVNARDAMPHGGTLTVAVENVQLDEHYAAMNTQAKPGRYVKISVTDTGTGIPPNIIDKIFEPFFTTKELGKGTGLGLSTVMAIVKSHNGLVNVYSEPGKGTTFKVYLPAVDSPDGAKGESLDSSSLPRGNGETILIVDDEEFILTITRQTLQAFGYRVLTAKDGAHAVAVYVQHQNEIAMVLTDMMMPVLDGAATIHALTRINPAVKIVAASGLNSNGNQAKAQSSGVKHFLTKPYTAETLLRTIRSVLDEIGLPRQ